MTPSDRNEIMVLCISFCWLSHSSSTYHYAMHMVFINYFLDMTWGQLQSQRLVLL